MSPNTTPMAPTTRAANPERPRPSPPSADWAVDWDGSVWSGVWGEEAGRPLSSPGASPAMHILRAAGGGPIQSGERLTPFPGSVQRRRTVDVQPRRHQHLKPGRGGPTFRI